MKTIKRKYDNNEIVGFGDLKIPEDRLSRLPDEEEGSNFEWPAAIMWSAVAVMTMFGFGIVYMVYKVLELIIK